MQIPLYALPSPETFVNYLASTPSMHKGVNRGGKSLIYTIHNISKLSNVCSKDLCKIKVNKVPSFV